MSSSTASLFILLSLMMPIPQAIAEQPSQSDLVLKLQLNNAESRLIQRQARPARTSDLLTDSNLRIAERRLNTLKTRNPGNTATPFLERKLDRLQRMRRR